MQHDFSTKYGRVLTAKEYSAHTAGVALFHYFNTFGMFDDLVWYDPGVNFMSEVVSKRLEWIGVRGVISLVDRHESNGVGGTKKYIIWHLRTHVHDLRYRRYG